MSIGYTRTFSKTTGQTILASDFNTEFQLIDDAFDATNGHTHDGTTNEGGYVAKLSDTNNYTCVEIDEGNAEIDFNINVSSAKVRQMVLTDGALLPDTTNDIDLGSVTYQFKDGWFDGIVYSDGLSVIGNSTLGGDVSITGDTTIGNLSTDTVTINAVIESNLIPSADDSYDIGSSTVGWQSLYLTDDIVFDGASNSANLLEFRDGTGANKGTWVRYNTITDDFDISKYLASDGTTVMGQITLPDDGDCTFLGSNTLKLYGGYSFSTATQYLDVASLNGQWDNNTIGYISIQTGSDTTNKDAGQMAFVVYESSGSANQAMNIWEDGTVAINIQLRLPDDNTPASASAAGTKGDIEWDSNYIYVCTATNTWKRAALSTW